MYQMLVVVFDALCVKSSSSYYSLSSSGDLESDKEAQDEHVAVLEEALGGCKKELWGGDSTYERQAMEDVSEKRVGTTKTGADWDLRKKTEKKLNEIEETQSRNEFSELRSRIAQTSEWDYGKVSNSQK